MYIVFAMLGAALLCACFVSIAETREGIFPSHKVLHEDISHAVYREPTDPARCRVVPYTQEPDTCIWDKPVDVVLIVGGLKTAEEAIVPLKSIIMYTKCALRFNLVVDNKTRAFLTNYFEGINSVDIDVEYRFAMRDDQWYLDKARLLKHDVNSHHSGQWTMARMFLHELFQDVNETVSIDTDMVILGDIATLMNVSRRLHLPAKGATNDRNNGATGTTKSEFNINMSTTYALWAFPLFERHDSGARVPLCSCIMVTDLSRFRPPTSVRVAAHDESENRGADGTVVDRHVGRVSGNRVTGTGGTSSQRVDIVNLVQIASEKFQVYDNETHVFKRTWTEQEMLSDIYRLYPEYFVDVPPRWKHSWCQYQKSGTWRALRHEQTSLVHFNCVHEEPVWGEPLRKLSRGLERLAQCVIDYEIRCRKLDVRQCGKIVGSDIVG